jgi:hypothetical protein
MSESLRQLLRRADAAPEVSDPSVITAEVRRRRADERLRNRQVLSVAAVLLLCVAVVFWPRRNGHIASTPDSTSADVAILTSLQIDARIHELTADSLIASDRTRRAKHRQEGEPDPIAQVRFQRDRAAMTLIYEADRFRAQPQQTDLAIAQYRKVISLVPASSGADVARQRLRDMTL